MKLTLKRLILDQFKGVAHAEYTFGERTSVSGFNGSGKTTISDAAYWLFADKDSSLKSNPEIHPDFMEESEPSVTAICDIDGKEVTLRKFQKDSRTKKQAEAGAPIRISNQYEINTVPKSQKDFASYLTECGINLDTFLLLTHPDIFTSQKSADCRKILFGMTSEVTDKEIAESVGCMELSAMLDNYTVEEITAMKKREKKEADENIDAIPNQIIGLEKAKVDIDVEEFTTQKETLQAEADAMEKALEELEIVSIGELNQQLAMLDKQEQQLIATVNANRVEKLSQMNLLIADMKREEQDFTASREHESREMAEALAKKNSLAEEFDGLAERFKEIKESEYDAGSGKCPYCGQVLPIHELDKARVAFEEKRAEEMMSINKRASKVKAQIRELTASISEHEANMKKFYQLANEKHEAVEAKCKEREPLERVIDVTQTEEHVAIHTKRAEIRHRMAERDRMAAEAEEITANIRSRRGAIREIEDTLAQAKNNDRIDAQIAELRKKQGEYSDAVASAEMILAQIQDVSMEKNKRLTEEVNSHFNIVRFKLFDIQKNGEFKDCCIPMIQTADGTYKTFGESANTALEVRGKLDIISGLQKFYDQNLFVFLDGAECLDEENMRRIHMDTQLITLSVSDDDLKVEVL